jgi:predicted AlkP superfamily phosphohydrolase/phosphomutase
VEPTYRRVLLIGLDAADKDLLADAMDRGELPVLRQLRSESAWGVVDSLPGFGSGAIWPSFSTGVSPAKHGRYFYRQVGPESYEAQRFEASAFHAKSFWESMSDAGRRVAVFDVPKMGLSERLNGIEAVDWLVHGPVYHELRTHPTQFAAELIERFGADPLPQCDLPGGRDARQHAELLDILRHRVATKGRAARHYLAQESWDLFVTVFADPHCVGHQCWHVRDPAHPQHDAQAHARVGDPVLEVYQSIDRAIGEMLEVVSDDTIVIVLSCTGMGPNYSGNLVLDEVLRRLEGRKAPAAFSSWSGLKRRAKQVLPIAVRRRGRRWSRRVEERVLHSDRQQRRCFAVPHNDMSGAIRVNLAGRDADGQVRPEEMDAFYAALRADLLALRNLETGGAVVEDVVRTADRCEGEHLATLPDFFVLWRRDAPIRRIGSPKIGEIEHQHRGNRTGDHRPDSIFFARGRGIAPGRVDGVSILDFAPTLAALAGVVLPETDGAPIRALTVASEREPARASA